MPSFAAAARIASISACAVGSLEPRIALRRLGDDLIAEGHDRADRHFAVGGGLGGKVKRAAHRRGKRKAHRHATASRARRIGVSYGALLVAAAAWFCAGF